MRLLFISNGKLPIPTSKGGAVETLIQTLIDNNEITKNHYIDIYTPYDDKSIKMIKKYKKCNFLLIKTKGIIYLINTIIRYIINRIPGIYIGNEFIHRVERDLKKNHKKGEFYDYVIIENCAQYALIVNKYFKDNLILHLHNDFLNKDIDMATKILNSYYKVFTLSDYINSRVKEIDKTYKNVYTLYNGIELDKFNVKSDLSNIKEKLALSGNDFIYLYTGRLVKEKGVKELLLAFKKLSDKVNNVKLIIVGNTDTKNIKNKKYISLLKKIALKCNEKVMFTGYVDYEKLYEYYAISNVGVIPSIWEEPFALTVVEHMALGHPVIITRSGGMVELVDDKCSIIIEKDENIVENLCEAMNKVRKDKDKFIINQIVNQAYKFSSKLYCDNFDKLLNKTNE